MLIFDRFPTLDKAQAFAKAAQDETFEQPILCLTKDHFDKYDFFPWELDYPVVLVPRLDDTDAEEALGSLVVEFDGEFAGT